MQYLFLMIGFAVAFHAYSYGKWLKQNGSKAGALGVFAIAALSLALPIMRIIQAP